MTGCSFDVAPSQGDRKAGLSGNDEDGTAGNGSRPVDEGGDGDANASDVAADAGVRDAGDPQDGGATGGDSDAMGGDGDGHTEGGDGDSTGDGDAGDGAKDAGQDAGNDAGDSDAGKDAGAQDAGEDAGAQDAGTDAGTQDAGQDSGTDPECPQDPPCRCPHLPALDDPCVVTCSVDECAPDDECTLHVVATGTYYFCTDERTWPQAEQRCERAEGMTLARIDSAEEDAFIYGEIEDKTWLGGGDHMEEGLWVWRDGTEFYEVDDGEAGPIGDAYTNFHPSEPNNAGLSSGAPDCLLYWYENATWADGSCTDPHGYVCEYTPPLP